MLELSFSSKLDWGSCIASIIKTPSKKIGALFHYMIFLSLEVALYLYKFTILPCKEYCCHVWAGAPSYCFLDMSDKLEKQVRTVGLSLTAFLGPLAHCRDVTSLSYFYRYCFGRSSSELAKLVPFPHSCGRPNCYSNGMHDFFLFPFLDFIGMYMSIVSFLAQTDTFCLQNASLWPIKHLKV